MWIYFMRPVRWFIEWWAGLDWWLRLGVPVALLAVSLVFLVFGQVLVIGWVLGTILLLCSGKSESEKKGYHF